MKLLVLCLLSGCFGAFLFDFFVSPRYEKKCHSLEKQIQKQKEYYELLNYWFFIKQNNISVVSWLKSKGYYKVAIYGMQELGKRLYEELRDTDIEIVCVMDKNQQNILGEYNFVDIDKNIPQIDVVIVTPVLSFFSIQKDLEKLVSCPIMPIEYLLHDAHNLSDV